MNYLSELEAEIAVNQSLMNEIKRLTGGKPMSDLLKLADGRIVEAENVNPISPTEVREHIAEVEEDINRLTDKKASLEQLLVSVDDQPNVPLNQPATAAIQQPTQVQSVTTPDQPTVAQPQIVSTQEGAAQFVNDVTPPTVQPIQLG